MKESVSVRSAASARLSCLANGFLAFMCSIALSTTSSFAQGTADPDADYDRLDGTGRSGKKVNVIEWEGNLEIHVYPAGSLKGLALKLDKASGGGDRKVMVIGYRFDAGADPLVRRAILGIDLREGFKAWRDPSADGYDKIVISNNGMAAPLVAFKFDPELKQLYPEGHPALAGKGSAQGEGAKAETRLPAGKKSAEGGSKETEAELDDSGTIKPFFMRERHSSRDL